MKARTVSGRGGGREGSYVTPDLGYEGEGAGEVGRG